MREKKSTGISHYQFAMLIGENLDERKMGILYAQFRCTKRVGRGRKSITVPGSGNSVNHSRIEKSTFQETCGNSGFATGEERVFLGGLLP